MEVSKFVIDILDLYWIGRVKDNYQDLCLHGEVSIKIGDENYDCTVSSTGLYLLKSLKADHIIRESCNQMLPCCGNFFIPSETDDTVEISGCNTGIDWTVLHRDGDIILITNKGNEVTIDYNSYVETVFRFVDEIESFYKKCTEKSVPTDEYERNGYIKFWREWHNRRKLN